jgi:type I restriction enzyme M protein
MAKTKKTTEQLKLIEAEPATSTTKAKKSQPPLTTAQQLGSIIKSARDIMRKDKGLNGDLDRLPMLTWIMFLKFLDDVEYIREQESALSGARFRRAIEPPYRWRDWAARPEAITGDELIAFVNNDKAIRPDGTEGPGLFAYLRNLQGAEGGDRRDVIATVFKGVINRMVNGYLLRDVINKINGIHFTSSEEIHTLGHLYESMLKEMRDAAGDSGEFYTPRAVVRLMVALTDPRIGETVLDPACGTGGFLVEAYQHLEKQCRTVQQREALQRQSIFGGEAKPLPYLLAQMNLLLHGLESPQIDPGNSLRFPLREIGDKERVDVILTNPPFGGEEERGILSNFPDDKQTAETALLFLQFIMRKLRRQPKPGRAAVVVPNGTLFGDGVCARIKEELLRDFNLHTIVRLPNGVFAPYTSIPTNLLFFDRSGPTKEIWYYEQPLPEGRRQYTKTAPIQYEEFADCLKWWANREENEHAWRINFRQIYEEARAKALPHWDAAQKAETKAKALEKTEKELTEKISTQQKVADLEQNSDKRRKMLDKVDSLKQERQQIQGQLREQRAIAREEQAAGDAIYWPIYNLDIKNPHAKQDFEHLPPEQLVEDILKKEQRIVELMAEMKRILADGGQQ